MTSYVTPLLTRGLAIIAFAGVLFWSQASIAQRGATQIISLSGELDLNGSGSFFSFGAPALNNVGQVAFHASQRDAESGSFRRGIFISDGLELSEVVRESQGRFEGEVTFNLSVGSSSVTLNDAGQVAFAALTFLSSPASSTAGIFRGDSTTVTPVARLGDPVPSGDGRYDRFGSRSGLALNNAGQVAFLSQIDTAAENPTFSQGLFVGNGTTTAAFVLTGDTAPDGDGHFFFFNTLDRRVDRSPPLNNLGQIAFGAKFSETSGGESNDSGVFLSDGASVTQIVREGQAGPAGDGIFTEVRAFNSLSLNDTGQVTFEAMLAGTDQGLNEGLGLYVGDGTRLTRLVRVGESAPDGNGTISGFRDVKLNTRGQAIFKGFLAETDGGLSDNGGIFRVDGENSIIQIGREGQNTPEGNGKFASLLNEAINDRGQVAFLAGIDETTGGSTDDFGLYFYSDELGLLPIVREGDALLGSTVTELSFNTSVLAPRGATGKGLNNLGQVAYWFELADGRSGIGIWSIPEPASLTLLVGLLFPLAGRYRV